MIKKIPRYFKHQDARGSIEGIINSGAWEEINIITSRAGTVRGGHYHKHTQEAFFILDGEIAVVTKNINTDTTEPEKTIVYPGDFFIVEPFVTHTFSVLKDSRWLNILSHKMTNKNKDIYEEIA